MFCENIEEQQIEFEKLSTEEAQAYFERGSSLF